MDMDSTSIGITACNSLQNTFIRQTPEKRSTVFKQKICINVRGMKFETYKDTLEKFPDTLLGSPNKREQFYDRENMEYYFDRDRTAFNCILFFYQSNGIISKPDDIPNNVFNEELLFYELVKNQTPLSSEEIENVPTNSFRSTVWNILEFPNSSTFAKSVANVSVMMIVLSTIIFCVETVPSFGTKKTIQMWRYNPRVLNESEPPCQSNSMSVKHGENHVRFVLNGSSINCSRINKSDVASRTGKTWDSSAGHKFDIWFILESVFISFFTCEYIARLYSAPKRIRFMKSALGIVDFTAVLPFYLTLVVQHDYQNVTSFSVIRVTRIVRVMRVLKLSRYHRGLAILARTIKESSGQMKSLFLCLLLTIVLFASAIYYIESYNKSSPFESIPATFWYVVITMTTVGYGDVIPRTPLGKLMGAACAFIGLILLLCLPTPVFVSNFVRFYTEECGSEDTKSASKEDLSSNKQANWSRQGLKNVKYVTVKDSKRKE